MLDWATGLNRGAAGGQTINLGKIEVRRNILIIYKDAITCLDFLIVSNDWSAYTLVPLSGWRAILSEKQRGPGRSTVGVVLASKSRSWGDNSSLQSGNYRHTFCLQAFS